MHVFRRLGLRVMTLTWNHENEVGFPAIKGSRQGLKAFGRELIKEMNTYGIAVDVSHLNVAGFWDVIEASERPIMASHSNALAQCDFPRNLYDRQIKAIIETNGYIGLNFCDEFMREGGGSDLSDVVRHANHILDLGGENALGMGSDFDGITGAPKELSGVQDFQLVMRALSDSGIDEATLHKIAYKNLLRYLEAHIKKEM
jgi:membrane dipeptidase